MEIEEVKQEPLLGKNKRITILNTTIDVLNIEETILLVEKYVKTKTPLHLMGVNANKINELNDNELMKKIVNSCGIINADGASVILASKYLNNPLPERVAGIDLMLDLISLSNNKGYSVYLLGAKQEIVEKTARILKKEYKDLNILGIRNGYFDKDKWPEISNDIKRLKPDFVFVGITSPIKEYLIEYLQNDGNQSVFMGVGGSFDVISGNKRRAPKWMQKCNLEWLFRVIQEPKRLFKRYFIGNWKFIKAIRKEKKTIKKRKKNNEENRKKMKVLMTGVDKNRLGGMWTVANNYITSEKYNKEIDLIYVPTSTNGNIVKRTLLMIKAFIKIKKIVSKQNIELVHIHMAEKGSTFRARIISKIAKKHNKKVVIHLHAGPFMDWYNTLNEKRKKQIREMMNQVDLIIVLGNYWKKSLSTLVNKEKIEVVYNGIPIPNSNNYNCKGENITFMGVLKKEKGIYDLVDSIKEIDSKLDKKYKIKVCGKDLEGNIQDYINQAGMNERIELTGWIEGEEKEKIITNTALNVLPSYFEALSMTVIESMGQGIPIVTTNISTMNEVLNQEKLLINPGNTKRLGELILELINNEKERKKISEKEYLRCKEMFDVDKSIEDTLLLYKKI